MTLEEIRLARKDLEKRLLIDMQQFEKDTGLRVSDINMTRLQVVGEPEKRLIDVETVLEVPR